MEKSILGIKKAKDEIIKQNKKTNSKKESKNNLKKNIKILNKDSIIIALLVVIIFQGGYLQLKLSNAYNEASEAKRYASNAYYSAQEAVDAANNAYSSANNAYYSAQEAVDVAGEARDYSFAYNCNYCPDPSF